MFKQILFNSAKMEKNRELEFCILLFLCLKLHVKLRLKKVCTVFETEKGITFPAACT